MTSVIVVAMLVVLAGAGARAAWLAGPTAAARDRLGQSSTDPRTGRWRSRPPAWILGWALRSGLSDQSVVEVWPMAMALAAAVVVGATVVFQLIGLMLSSAAILVGTAVLGRRLRAQARHRRARALPVLLEDVARGLRSGASLRQSLEQSIERADVLLAPELRRVCDTVAQGGSLDAALQTWCARQPSEGLRLAVAALSLGIDAGGARGRALDGVASSLRDRAAVDRELAALSSQARASAAVMAVAPVVFAGFAAATDRHTAHFLGGTPAGWMCLASGLVLDGIAAWWMVKLTGAIR